MAAPCRHRSSVGRRHIVAIAAAAAAAAVRVDVEVRIMYNMGWATAAIGSLSYLIHRNRAPLSCTLFRSYTGALEVRCGSAG